MEARPGAEAVREAQGRGSRPNLPGGAVRKEGGLRPKGTQRSCEDKRCLFQTPEHILFP